jgi:hypothetical protein
VPTRVPAQRSAAVALQEAAPRGSRRHTGGGSVASSSRACAAEATRCALTQ